MLIREDNAYGRGNQGLEIGQAFVFIDNLIASRVWRLFSALRAGILSSCFAKKKVAKEEGDPRVGAPCGGPLRYSKRRAAG